jgi:pyruvate,water dikinase
LRQLKSQPKKNQQKKLKVLNALGLPQTLKATINVLDTFGWIQDTRKGMVLRLNHFLFQFAKELSRRTGLSKQEILYLIPPEIPEVLLKKHINRKVIKQRVQHCLLLFTPQGYALFSGKRAQAARTRLQQNASADVIWRGLPVYPGLVSGQARIINTAADIKKFRQGEVLLTNNTTPEFVPIITKARAIVTEQGGVTTHAAIISREFRIPCVVGVAGITKTIKTGDNIEVNAMKGIIKKL